jgi:hypothetical protein
VLGLLKRGDKVYAEIVSDCSAARLQSIIRGNAHINDIESFWGYAKIRLVKFKGMNKKMFNLHLKECEFRFNNRKQNLYKVLLGMFRKEPLKLS